MQNEFAQFAFAQFAHFCSFLQGKNIITAYVSIHYKTHHCFASKLSKSKLSKLLFLIVTEWFQIKSIIYIIINNIFIYIYY